MVKLNSKRFIYILFLLCLTILTSILYRSITLSVLFFICNIVGIKISKAENYYDNLYYTLIISAIFEYTYFIPGHPKIYFFHIFLVIFTIANLIKIIKYKELTRKINKKIIIFFIIWFLYIVSSYIWSLSKSLALKYIIIYTLMFIFTFNIIIYNDSKSKIKKSISVLALMFFISVLIGWVEALTAMQLPVVHYYDNFSQYKIDPVEILKLRYRPISFYYNPNNYGTYLTICLPFLIYAFYFSKEKFINVLYLISIIASFIILILTTSRFNIFALALILITFLVVTFSSDKKRNGIMYSILFCVLFILVYNYANIFTANTDYLTKMNQLSITAKKGSLEQAIGQDGSEDIRLTIASDVLEGIIKDKHYFGFGAGNSTQYLMNRGNTHLTYNPHGWFIELFGDFGILFILFYGVGYLYLLHTLIKKFKSSDVNEKYFAFAFFTSLVGFLIGSFSPSSVTYFLPNWMIFAYTLSFIAYDNN